MRSPWTSNPTEVDRNRFRKETLPQKTAILWVHGLTHWWWETIGKNAGQNEITIHPPLRQCHIKCLDVCLLSLPLLFGGGGKDWCFFQYLPFTYRTTDSSYCFEMVGGWEHTFVSLLPFPLSWLIQNKLPRFQSLAWSRCRQYLPFSCGLLRDVVIHDWIAVTKSLGSAAVRTFVERKVASNPKHWSISSWLCPVRSVRSTALRTTP